VNNNGGRHFTRTWLRLKKSIPKAVRGKRRKLILEKINLGIRVETGRK
jgi:hypothetical protein